MYAVTSGLGVVPPEREVGDHRVRPGDVLVASGSLGDHGATIMACRHGMAEGALTSDCAPLSSLVQSALHSGAGVRTMHDPTRGGAATVCHEVAGRTGLRIVLEEKDVPIREETRGVCELLGLDPLYLACEGRVLFWVASEDVELLVNSLAAHPLGRGAAAIGRVEPMRSGVAPVVLRTPIGGDRPLDLLSGAELPRIC